VEDPELERSNLTACPCVRQEAGSMASSVHENGPVDISVGEAVPHALEINHAIYVIHALADVP
jgi:hypothetical protein